jgi:uncharacterized OB-fold protein
MGEAAEYLGMPLLIDESDVENRQYFRYCAQHDFHLQQCDACHLVRYPPTTACPWCATRAATWMPVEGKGEVVSYTKVTHAIQPAFKPHLPYLVLLVELETQRGVPTPSEAIRVIGNLVDATGMLASPDMVQAVGIGSKVRMTFTDVGPDISLPQWVVDGEAVQPASPWRFAG